MQERNQITIERYGNAQTLAVSRRPWDGGVDPGEVAIAVEYSGINFADIQMRLGFYPDAPKRPFVPGYEVSGVVDAVGEGVDTVAVGDRVIAGTYFGGYASHVKVPAHQILPLPQGLSLEQGAALPVNFFTAHLALVEMARVRAGDKVLIECATGGVGTLATQMARTLGATVLGLTTSPDKLGYIQDLGATAMTREAFEADDSQRGFDFILNASGGPSINLQRERLDLTGRMVCMGLNSGVKDGRRNLVRMGLAALRTPRLGVLSLMNENCGVFGLNALKVLEDELWVRRLVAAFSEMESMGISPVVDRVFPAHDVSEAHHYLETKQARGKLVLAWSH
jgi:NADPH:quinone reductase-like Zn-dependent oxidoreductase